MAVKTHCAECAQNFTPAEIETVDWWVAAQDVAVCSVECLTQWGQKWELDGGQLTHYSTGRCLLVQAGTVAVLGFAVGKDEMTDIYAKQLDAILALGENPLRNDALDAVRWRKWARTVFRVPEGVSDGELRQWLGERLSNRDFTIVRDP